ncbi:YceI family protein [Deinococcus sp. UYEF24]
MRNAFLFLALLSLPVSAAPATFTVVSSKTDLNLMTVESQTAVENFTGRTSSVSGKLTFDPVASVGSGSVTVNGASITTGVPPRDGHMRGAEWLNFDKSPAVKFETLSVKRLTGDIYEVRGNLTLNDVTKAVVTRATVKYTPASPAIKALGITGNALAVSTSFPIKLSDYNVKNARIDQGQVSNTLTVSLKFIASS